MPWNQVRAVVAVALSLALTSGCADPVAPTPPVPAVPTILETFTATLNPTGLNQHRFTINQVGGLQVTLTDVQPGAALGIGIGLSVSVSCSVISSATTVPGSVAQVAGTATLTGTYCVSVFDVGNLVEPVTYTITVLHS